jgi:23S rRNA (cytosine1962-C5)-methyltransferase
VASSREPGPPDGSLVEVQDASERFIGHALYNASSDIRLRWLSRGRRRDLDRPFEFLQKRLRDADAIRRRLLRLEEVSDAYRIVHAEADDLPGLIVDRLADVLVCEHHARGFWEWREEIELALKSLYPGFRVVHRVPQGARKAEGFDPPGLEDEEPLTVVIEERGLRYEVHPGRRHKTGWFCDQRDNRFRIGKLARGRDVLDLCCNSGGFSLQSARAGARRVLAVDLDEQAVELAERAARLNDLDIEVQHADAFDILRSVQRRPDRERPGVVILDPPKLAAGKRQLEMARKKYSDLNTLALEAVRSGGILATFSCSGALDLPTFLGILFASARRAQREIRLLELLGAGPDHPQRPDWPRSRYLKGALLALDRN